MTPKTLARRIAALALTKKAHDVTVMDLRKITDVSDFFVICSGDSDTQVRAIADAVADGTEEIGISPWHREGLSQRQWVLLDYVDVVVHIFHRDTRKFYALEKLWGDARVEVVEDSPTPAPDRALRPPKGVKTHPSGRRRTTHRHPSPKVDKRKSA